MEKLVAEVNRGNITLAELRNIAKTLRMPNIFKQHKETLRDSILAHILNLKMAGNVASSATVVMEPKAKPVTTGAYKNPKNVAGLTNIAKEFLYSTYGLELNIPIQTNNRLQRSLGRFMYRTVGRQALRIEISQKLLNYYEEETIVDVLKHELVHYACFTLGKPHHDGSAHFENELKRLNISRTGVIEAKGEVHEYKCSCCGQVSTSRRQFSTAKYISKCCKSKFEYLGKVVR